MWRPVGTGDSGADTGLRTASAAPRATIKENVHEW
jgi:hypothetical protein